MEHIKQCLTQQMYCHRTAVSAYIQKAFPFTMNRILRFNFSNLLCYFSLLCVLLARMSSFFSTLPYTYCIALLL